MKNSDLVETSSLEIKAAFPTPLVLWLSTTLIWSSLIFFNTLPNQGWGLTAGVQGFAGLMAFVNVLIQFAGYRKSLRTAYYKVADDYETMYTDKRAVNAFTAKYRSPLSIWSMNFFGRPAERVLIGEYALKEPITGKIRKTVSSYQLSDGEAVALEAGKHDFSADHPYVMSNYLAVTSKGMQIEQEVKANPLMLWDSALKDVSEQYDLESYFAAKQRKELEEEVSNRAIQSMLDHDKRKQSDNYRQIINAFTDLIERKDDTINKNFQRINLDKHSA